MLLCAGCCVHTCVAHMYLDAPFVVLLCLCWSQVELFALTEGTLAASEPMLEEIVRLQVEFFSTLGLHFQVGGNGID